MEIVKANKQQDFIQIESLAKIIWREHFTPIIGAKQVEYMLEKFLSADAMKKSVENENYEFYELYEEKERIGFIAIHPEVEMLFLSKLYIRKDKRGKGYASVALQFLKEICMKRNLKGIWLTCNKYNNHTLAVYKHMGFEIFEEAVNDIGHGYVMDDYYLRIMM